MFVSNTLHGVRLKMAHSSGLKPPSHLCLKGNLDANYKEWIRQYEIHSMPAGVNALGEDVQCNIFLHVAGLHAQKVHSTWTFADADNNKIGPLKDKFVEYCKGKNLIITRYQFNTTNQATAFDTYLTDLKNKITDCEYGDLRNSFLRDRLVCGVHDETLREKLLRQMY